MLWYEWYILPLKQCTSRHLPTFSDLLPDKVKNNEIEMKPNQAYETVCLPSPPRPATHVHTEPCPAYEVIVQAHH